MTKVPPPVKVKQEEEGVLHPMSFYIDDRVDLIKQVFDSLKPKTIRNLAPSFLKKHSLEEIEEQCLNELLGISSKRLRSIIQDTKCPSDTESSSDSDVDKIEAHISLEEISSDEGVKQKANGKAKKLHKKKHKDSSKKDKDSQESNSSAEKPNKTKKDLSVLELLELQARARAIRSQLALEPVTKIEVDSDDDEEDKEPVASSSKKVVLNRNFGRQNSGNEQSQPPEKKARSPSPDIVPIVPSTVTLCISDSEEEENVENPEEKIEEESKVSENDTQPKEEAEDPAASNEQDSDRDDVISLGGVDIIDLDNSDVDVGKDDEGDWNSRWLSSNKVSKVLTSAKLGKKLRDKVKEKKSHEKQKKKELMDKRKREEEETLARRKAADKIINSKKEGTLEQFRILKELEGKSDKK